MYFYCRGVDEAGSGVVELSLKEFQAFIDRKESTVYEWLRKAEADNVIRYWNIRQDKLTIYYSSLVKVCYERGLTDLGAVANVPIDRVKDLQSTACEVTALDLQEKSRKAALKTLNSSQRKHLGIPTAKELLSEDDPDQQGVTGENYSSYTISNQDSSAEGFVLHKGHTKVFVGKNFVPFGSSQASIAAAMGCSDRTVRNYLDGIDRKQILQTKPEYSLLSLALAQDIDHSIPASPDIYLDIDAGGAARLFETNGLTNSSREGGHPVNQERFFTYFNKTWMYRNNIYSINIELCSYHFQRERLKKLIVQKSEAAESTCKTAYVKIVSED